VGERGESTSQAGTAALVHAGNEEESRHATTADCAGQT